jgi:hypothetical protein
MPDQGDFPACACSVLSGAGSIETTMLSRPRGNLDIGATPATWTLSRLGTFAARYSAKPG